MAPLDDIVAGMTPLDKIVWSDEMLASFINAKSQHHTAIQPPRPDDQLWIVTDGSLKERGFGSTLYITRNDTLQLSGFFSAKLRKHGVTWLPCEVEALGIAAAVKHFSPYIIQSKKKACVQTTHPSTGMNSPPARG